MTERTDTARQETDPPETDPDEAAETPAPTAPTPESKPARKAGTARPRKAAKASGKADGSGAGTTAAARPRKTAKAPKAAGKANRASAKGDPADGKAADEATISPDTTAAPETSEAAATSGTAETTTPKRAPKANGATARAARPRKAPQPARRAKSPTGDDAPAAAPCEKTTTPATEPETTTTAEAAKAAANPGTAETTTHQDAPSANGTAASAPGSATAPADPSVPPARSAARVRVLWLAKGLGLGGAERLLVNCARHVDRARFDVEVAYVLPYKDALAADLERAGILVHCLVGKPDRRRPDPLWPMRLRALVKERGYGLVHTHMPVPAVAARLLLRGEQAVPLVHTEHNMWARYRLPTRLANAATYGRNSAVIAVSRAVAGSIGKDRGEGWLSVVHHGPDLEGAPAGPQARMDARTSLGVPRNAVVIGTVGNHTAKKDQRTLLDAFALMRRNHPDTVLVLIGSGPLEQRLREHATSLGLGDSAVFAGSRTDVPSLLPGFDVFALSSRQEGLPVALMEAMASGLPSVVTRVGGMPEIVDEGMEGLLVQPGDVEALSVALGRLVGGNALRARMSAAARERARHFDAAGAQRTIEAVYDRVLAAGSAP